MCTRGAWVLLVLLLWPARSSAVGVDDAEISAWWRDSRPVFVLVVVDGLRADALEKDAPWDGALMPQVRSLREEFLRFEDVWTELGDRQSSFRQMLTGSAPAPTLLADPAQPVDLTWWPTAGEIWTSVADEVDLDSLSAHLGRLLRHDEGGTLVLRLRDLEFPLSLTARELEGLDPRPWGVETAGPVEIRSITARRLREAMSMARQKHPLERKLNDHDLEIYTWIVDAAHRALDRRLAGIFERLQSLDAGDRLSWALSATGATGYHHHRLGTLGKGAVVETLHVPLWWHLPARLHASGARTGAHVLRDLRRTLVAWSEGASHRGLFGESRPERLAFASGLRRVGRQQQRWTQLRWATADFALIDLEGSPPRIQLFDRRIDPLERTPRGAESEALWDSLRTELSHRALGRQVDLVVQTRLSEGSILQFAVDAAPSLLSIPNGQTPRILPYAGGSLIRWTVPGGPSPTLRMTLPGELAGLRLRRDGLKVPRLALGRASYVLPVQEELRIVPNTSSFLSMLQAPQQGSEDLTMWWDTKGWWTTR